MSTALASLLLIALGLYVLCVPHERQRLARGFRALHEAFGLQFVGAMGLTIALLLGAVYRHHSGLALVLCLILVVVAIRAHDLGEPEEPDAETEFERFWNRRQWTPEEIEQIRAQAQRPHVFNRIPGPPARLLVTSEQFAELERSPDWQRTRHEVAFGRLREPVEL